MANRERDLDEPLLRVPGDALVVVDQVRNIGSLALKRAAVAGLESAYLPGTAMHGASRLFAGDAKTDERAALVIAQDGDRHTRLAPPVPRPDAVLDAARAMASQRDYLVAGATRDKNRLRSILLESCPAFESLVDLSDPHCLRDLYSFFGHGFRNFPHGCGYDIRYRGKDGKWQTATPTPTSTGGNAPTW